MNKLASICLIAITDCASTKLNRPLTHPNDYQLAVVMNAASQADRAAGRTDGVTASATVTYWMGLKEALHPLPIDSEIAAKDIGKLPTEGVDPDLLREGQVAGEKMRRATDSIGSMPVVTILLRIPSSRWLEAEALSKAAIEQCYLVEQMRRELTVRYGVEFPPLDVPKH